MTTKAMTSSTTWPTSSEWCGRTMCGSTLLDLVTVRISDRTDGAERMDFSDTAVTSAGPASYLMGSGGAN